MLTLKSLTTFKSVAALSVLLGGVGCVHRSSIQPQALGGLKVPEPDVVQSSALTTIPKASNDYSPFDGTNRVRITWTASLGADEITGSVVYQELEVRCLNHANPEWRPFKQLDTFTESLDITNISDGATIQFRMRNVYSRGSKSEPSTELTFSAGNVEKFEANTALRNAKVVLPTINDTNPYFPPGVTVVQWDKYTAAPVKNFNIWAAPQGLEFERTLLGQVAGDEPPIFVTRALSPRTPYTITVDVDLENGLRGGAVSVPVITKASAVETYSIGTSHRK